MSDIDNFQLNIDAVKNLVGSNTNKTFVDSGDGEGTSSDEQDLLSLDLSDEELLELKDQYETSWSGYWPKIKARTEKNKLYLVGKQRPRNGQETPVPSNLLFEATATFVPAALAKNPEPVVWSDNTPAGKQSSSDIKTTLQYHAETLELRKKLGVMVWHWSCYFIAVLKYGWDAEIGDITVKVRNPKDMLFDPNGFVDEFGHFEGWTGERIEITAKELIKSFPSKREFIIAKVNGKLGTMCIYTEWWVDDFSFSTFYDEVLDAHKNEFWNYPTKETHADAGVEEEVEVPGHNHFAKPMKPYTFLSVFSLQEQPHDITNLIEQNIANQDQINDRDEQIDKNCRQSNNSLVLSGIAFNQETAHQAAQAVEDGDPILSPNGDTSESAVRRLPANALPSGLMDAQENNKNTLRGIYGTQGLTATAPDTDQTAHGMVIDSNRDGSRVGGGMGDSLETVAKSAFNYILQMYYKFYDEPHFASIMGNGAAVSYVMLQMQDQARRFVVSVSPNSMKPHDEVTEQNLAIELSDSELLDPLSLFERIDDPDPQETATRLMLYKTNIPLYIQTYLSPQNQPQGAEGQAPQGGNVPDQQGTPPATTSAPPASSALPPLSNSGQPNI